MKQEFVHDDLASSLSGVERVALARVAEESAELAIEAMKAQRFGIENRYPEDAPTNREKMIAELNDIEEALVAAGVLQMTSVQTQQQIAEIRYELYHGTYGIPIEGEACNAFAAAAHRALERLKEF